MNRFFPLCLRIPLARQEVAVKRLMPEGIPLDPKSVLCFYQSILTFEQWSGK